MIGTSDLKRGVMIEMDNAPWVILDCQFQTPSARGASTIVKIKVRNLKTGAVLTKSFRGGDTVEEADCEKRPVQFLYRQDDEFVFMDDETYDQLTLLKDVLGDAPGYLIEGMKVRSLHHNGEVFSVELPNNVDLTVTDTAPAIKGATAQAQMKPATLETGIEIQVPPYLETGEKVKVDTRDGRFIERVKS